MAAASALGEIGDPRAVEPLIAALRDRDWGVRGEAAKALEKIDPNWPKSEAAKRQVPEFIAALRDRNSREEAAKALGQIGDAKAVRALTSALRNESDYNRKEIRGSLKRIKGLQAPLLELYPYLLCTKCRLRAKRQKARVILLNSHTYVACRGCGSSLDLIKGIKKVIGLIGGDVDDSRVDGERVYVNLWAEAQKAARNADIDLLEIRNSSNITYDYAINAVWVALTNDASRPRKYVKRIPVILKDNPPLSENSRRILEREFGGIKPS